MGRLFEDVPPSDVRRLDAVALRSCDGMTLQVGDVIRRRIRSSWLSTGQDCIVTEVMVHRQHIRVQGQGARLFRQKFFDFVMRPTAVEESDGDTGVS